MKLLPHQGGEPGKKKKKEKKMLKKEKKRKKKKERRDETPVHIPLYPSLSSPGSLDQW